MKFFNKIAHGATRFFNKVGHDAPRILGKVSVGFRKFGNTMSQIADNPLVQAAATASGNSGALQAMHTAANLGSQASALTNTKNYSGNVNQVSQNILERAQNMQATANAPPVLYH